MGGLLMSKYAPEVGGARARGQVLIPMRKYQKQEAIRRIAYFVTHVFH